VTKNVTAVVVAVAPMRDDREIVEYPVH